MKSSTLLTLAYGSLGLVIASFSAAATYLIIGEPIGMTMLGRIVLAVAATLPLIVLVSYMLGKRFSSKIETQKRRLDTIMNGDYTTSPHQERIEEFAHIADATNRLAARLGDTVTSLERQNSELSRLMLSFAHDVKTPLSIMQGYLEEIEDGLIDGKRLPEIFELFGREIAFIDTLANEVIGYRRSRERNALPADIALAQCVKEAATALRIETEIAIGEAAHIRFDPDDLRRVLLNLMHNARKFSPTLRVTFNDGELCLEDEGIGIAAEDAQRIFEPYFTVDTSKNRQKSGFGLGLSIARNLCERNGYTLTLDESYRNGARFCISGKSPQMAAILS